jgi:hypothetical protein
VTAHHIAENFAKMIAETEAAQRHEATESQIKNDAGLNRETRRRNLANLGSVRKDQTDRCSAWWGGTGGNVKLWHSIPAVDLAVGKLDSFDPKSISIFPTFKDPDKDFVPGTSLCKMGFPFHHITPTWNDAVSRFELPPGALPLPLFPIDGILTRLVNVDVQNPDGTVPPPPPYPLQLLETSTPGLRGQSGGPTFDIQGTVWGIQVQTRSLSLGFDPTVPGGKPTQKEHQFLNVGLGAHSATIIGFFKQLGITFSMSAY